MAEFKDSVILIPVKELNPELAKAVSEETKKIVARMNRPTEVTLDLIVSGILHDISDRRDLKRVLQKIDADVIQEIKDAWKRIIADGFGLTRPPASRDDSKRG